MFRWQGSGGFSVDASVRIGIADRAGTERLVRYCARGESHALLISADGLMVTLGSYEIRTARMASALRRLHELAAALLEHEWDSG